MTLSNEKSREICDLIRNRLAANKHTPVSSFQSDLLEEGHEIDLNKMSQTIMQRYIDSYWQIFHPRLPILHRPSFSPNTSPNLLLVAIIIIGASCSVESNDHATPRSQADFSKVLAWYLRRDIFESMQSESENLFVFQALLLLEVYEKLYSSRALHERADIHHVSSINLMRRENIFEERSPFDSPQCFEDNISGTEKIAMWSMWIRREATRRVAFAAFLMDTMHSTMFGHSMTIVTHELRLVLPCDDALWSASFNEICKIETSLLSNGAKSIYFHEGLQKTLSGQEISTNPFGRSILLCGLLSVRWHMNQRDMQASSLDVGSLKAAKGTKWLNSIVRAFDLWRASCEQKGQDLSGSVSLWSQETKTVIENEYTLHYLAQFNMNVDMVQCQICAGAHRVLGRIVGRQEVKNAQQRVRKVWAPTVEAQKATFFALRFLCSVFHEMPDSDQVYDHTPVLNRATGDLPIHRWLVYSAALTVWCYSYAVDGPLRNMKSTDCSDLHEMKQFLKGVENIKSPEDVILHRLNGCTVMLKVLCYIFRTDTWELLREGADLLANCIKLMEI